MSRSSIGEFEELALLAVGALGDAAYGLAVRDLLKEEVGRSVSLGAVHATLYRLQDKGFLESSLGGATQDRGGRRKRMFRLAGTGVAALESARQARERLRGLLPSSMKPSLG